MTTYRTGNAIGSADPRDLYDNAENLDEMVNSQDKTEHPDRLGVPRKTWHGMEEEFDGDQARRENEHVADQASREQRFRTFIASSGYQFAGDYAAGIEITQYNQIIRDSNGEFWRVSGSTALPYTTTGVGLPEGGAFVAVGDAVLRQELADTSTPSAGSSLVGHRGGSVRSALDSRVNYVDTIQDLRSMPTAELSDGDLFEVTRGGRYKYSAARDAFDLLAPHAGEKLTDKILSSAQIGALYVRQGSDDEMFVGVSFVTGDGSTPPHAVEYKFSPDSNGWIRGRGAVSGYQGAPSSGFYGVEPSIDGILIQSPSSNNAYVTDVGAKFYAVIKGPSVQFTSYRENRGGVWRIKVGNRTYDISTYSATSGTVTETITDELAFDREYLIVGEFIGDDPENPPSSGAGTSRGWINYQRTGGTAVYPYALTPADPDRRSLLNRTQVTRDIISYRSVNEFAFRVSNPAVAGNSWVPAHTEGVMLSGLTQSIYIDGKKIQDINSVGGTREIQKIVIEQGFIFRQEDDSLDLGVCTTRHIIDRSGKLRFNYTVRALVDFLIPIWYPAQMGVSYAAHSDLLLNNGTRIKLSDFTAPYDDSLEHYNVDSAAFCGVFAGTEAYQAAAIDISLKDSAMMGWNPSQTEPPLRITKREDDVFKLYWVGSSGSVWMRAGESVSIGVDTACVIGLDNLLDALG